MNVRFNTDADGQLHIHAHHVDVSEVLEVLARPIEQAPGRADSTVVIGRTRAGRLLKVIHAPSRDGNGIFVVTAYDLPAKQLRALNRRRRRRHL
jgi:hypothetical protein